MRIFKTSFLTSSLTAVLLLTTPLFAIAENDAETETTSDENAESLHPLKRALELAASDYETLDPEVLLEAADYLWYWSFMGPDAPVKGSMEEKTAALKKSNEILHVLRKRTPRNPTVYAFIGRNNYEIGERLPQDAKDEKLALYNEIIDLTTHCVEKVDPEYPPCWAWQASGNARLGTTEGILSSLFGAKDVEQAWLKAIALERDVVALNGDSSANNSRYGLGAFYRLVPDSFVVRMVAGTRGSKEKSVQYFREAVTYQPNRLELQKELGIALICYGQNQRRGDAQIEEGKALLRKVVAGAFDAEDIRLTDEIDKRHSREILESPSRACGYSRDGDQDLDESKIEK